jgi:hypothetical protein
MHRTIVGTVAHHNGETDIRLRWLQRHLQSPKNTECGIINVNISINTPFQNNFCLPQRYRQGGNADGHGGQTNNMMLC